MYQEMAQKSRSLKNKYFALKEKKGLFNGEIGGKSGNASGKAQKSKIFEKQILCIEREKKVYYKTSPKKFLKE